MKIEERLYQQAKQKTKARKEVIKKMISFISVGSFLIFLNLFIGGYFWAKWPILGMGIGLFFAVVNFLKVEKFGMEWEDKHIGREMKKMYDRYDIPIREVQKEEPLDLNTLRKKEEVKTPQQSHWNNRDFV